MILKYLKKISDNKEVENGVYIHKKCNLRVNSIIKKLTEDDNNNEDDYSNENLYYNEIGHVKNIN